MIKRLFLTLLIVAITIGVGCNKPPANGNGGGEPVDETPPVISAVSVSGITETGATITWTTDEPSTSKVEYGTTAGYGQAIHLSALNTSHSVTLNGLVRDTIYHFRVKSSDEAGNEARSADDTFATLAVDWQFNGFTVAPVDFETLLDTSTKDELWSPLSPYFNYSNNAHAEGPRKWYLYAPDDTLMNVYLPARAKLSEDNIRIIGSGDIAQEYLNGEKVHVNIQARFQVSDDINVIFMHLTLRDEIKRQVDESTSGYAVFEAGTHIGYMYYPPWNSLDFTVEDRSTDSGLMPDTDYWWNIRANPFDYFTPELQQSLLDYYQPTYDMLAANGTTPYSDLEDSRSNINVDGTIWGVWFKDDLEDPFITAGAKWSIINFVKTEYLHQQTYWKTLQENPSLSGLYTENTSLDVVGKPFYDGEPFGKGFLFIVSGDATAGVAKIQHQFLEEIIYFKYKVDLNGSSKFDDELRIEAFSTQNDAETATFTDAMVTFRRTN